ncbi:hypothetical protein M3Y95_00993100 [Aphelenchoides besseyi]|nr:hypothetical protein M3Y95_00993100 [Aphelenchoides besseyi]
MRQNSSDIPNVYQELQQKCRESKYCGRYGFYFYTSISFALFFLLLIKFFGFDRTSRCMSDLCEFQMAIVIFSLAYSTIHLSALLCAGFLLKRVLCFPNENGIPLAYIFTGIGFFIVTVVAFGMTVYAANGLETQWSRGAFYCLCWFLQPIFTLLSVYMKQQEDQATDVVTAKEQKEEIESTDSDTISPRLSAALIRQWTDRLSEVEYQNNPIQMRRTVREVLQHMNSLIRS